MVYYTYVRIKGDIKKKSFCSLDKKKYNKDKPQTRETDYPQEQMRKGWKAVGNGTRQGQEGGIHTHTHFVIILTLRSIGIFMYPSKIKISLKSNN